MFLAVRVSRRRRPLFAELERDDANAVLVGVADLRVGRVGRFRLGAVGVVANGEHGIHVGQSVHGLVAIRATRAALDHERVHAQSAPVVPRYAVRTARPRLDAYGVRTVLGASGQAALRLWYVQHAGGWYA